MISCCCCLLFCVDRNKAAGAWLRVSHLVVTIKWNLCKRESSVMRMPHETLHPCCHMVALESSVYCRPPAIWCCLSHQSRSPPTNKTNACLVVFFCCESGENQIVSSFVNCNFKHMLIIKLQSKIWIVLKSWRGKTWIVFCSLTSSKRQNLMWRCDWKWPRRYYTDACFYICKTASEWLNERAIERGRGYKWHGAGGRRAAR